MQTLGGWGPGGPGIGPVGLPLARSTALTLREGSGLTPSLRGHPTGCFPKPVIRELGRRPGEDAGRGPGARGEAGAATGGQG